MFVKKFNEDDSGKEGNLDDLLKTLPPVIARCNLDKYLGGIIKRGTIANMDYLGKGPKRIKIGRNTGYIREDLVMWLKSRMTTDDELSK